jgi:hypothetical protein
MKEIQKPKKRHRGTRQDAAKPAQSIHSRTSRLQTTANSAAVMNPTLGLAWKMA